jgi:hypothetical protein
MIDNRSALIWAIVFHAVGAWMFRYELTLRRRSPITVFLLG